MVKWKVQVGPNRVRQFGANLPGKSHAVSGASMSSSFQYLSDLCHFVARGFLDYRSIISQSRMTQAYSTSVDHGRRREVWAHNCGTGTAFPKSHMTLCISG